MLEQICAPALLYVVFSLTQIIIDIFKNLYNTAFLKFIVMILFTIMLNFLCDQGLGLVSWFIVFIPFIMMTIITTLLLFVFGLSPSSGKLKYTAVDYPSQREQSSQREQFTQRYQPLQTHNSLHYEANNITNPFYSPIQNQPVVAPIQVITRNTN